MTFEKHSLLMIPGPTEVSAEALLSMAQPTIPHYGDDWVQLHRRVVDKLKRVFRTNNDIFIIPGSSSAAMEAAVNAVIEPGDKVLVELSGFMCRRFMEIVEGCGGQVMPLEFEWGTAVDPERVEQALVDDPDIKVMTLVHNETTTGITSPAASIGEICRKHEVILICDAVSSMGGIDVRVDDWNLDLCMTGNQKCLQSPPGLGLLSVSAKAWSRIAARKRPIAGWFLNLQNIRNYSEMYDQWHPQGPVTAPTALYAGLDVSLDAIIEEGLEQRFHRHSINARAFREALKAMGIKLFADEQFASSTVTAFHVPEGVEAGFVQDTLKHDFDTIITGGIDILSGRILRVGHMGLTAHPRHITSTIVGIGHALRKAGAHAHVGDAIDRALQIYNEL